jgi:uncharacterized protein DUF4261
MLRSLFGRRKRGKDKEPAELNGFAPVYMIELFGSQPFAFNEPAYRKAIEAALGEVDAAEGTGGKSFQYFLREFVIDFREGMMPAQLVVFPGGAEEPNWKKTDALRQSWRLPDVEARLGQCPHGAIFSDLMCALLEQRSRRKILSAGLRCLIRHSNAELVHFMPTMQVLDAKDALVKLSEPDEMANPAYGFLNVRFYNIAGANKEKIMDTLGLAALGLNDFQIHYRNLDPSAVAGVMESLGRYALEHGDIVENGHTIQGLTADQKWRCQREISMLEPKRAVIDINPGPEFAAGNRER